MGLPTVSIPRLLPDRSIKVHQVRGGGFYPSALETGMRSERALHLALAEMYVQGVSTGVRFRKGC